jgi:predicted esterase
MNSTGEGPKRLKSLGYHVKQIETTVNWPTTILGRFKRYPVLRQTIGGIADRRGNTHMATNVNKHDEEIGDFQPDIVIGTSQGGAVAMSLAARYPHAKFILGAPAWKIFHVRPSGLPKDSIILHGKNDGKIPVQDSVELAAETGAELTITNDPHDINFSHILAAVLRQATRIKKANKSNTL